MRCRKQRATRRCDAVSSIRRVASCHPSTIIVPRFFKTRAWITLQSKQDEYGREAGWYARSQSCGSSVSAHTTESCHRRRDVLAHLPASLPVSTCFKVAHWWRFSLAFKVSLSSPLGSCALLLHRATRKQASYQAQPPAHDCVQRCSKYFGDLETQWCQKKRHMEDWSCARNVSRRACQKRAVEALACLLL